MALTCYGERETDDEELDQPRQEEEEEAALAEEPTAPPAPAAPPRRPIFQPGHPAAIQQRPVFLLDHPAVSAAESQRFPRDRAPAHRSNFRPLPAKANGRSFCPISNRLLRGLSRQCTRQHANKPSDIQSNRGSNGKLHCGPIRPRF
jgi:hypothetical protein